MEKNPVSLMVSAIWETNKPKQRCWGTVNKNLIYVKHLGSMGLGIIDIVENLRMPHTSFHT